MNLGFQVEMAELAMENNEPGTPFYEKMRCMRDAYKLHHADDIPKDIRGPKIIKLLDEADEWDEKWKLERST